jgi:hypothetical protein
MFGCTGLKTKMHPIIKKFGRKKKPLDEESKKLILEVPQRAKFGCKAAGKNHRVRAWKAFPA